MSDEASCEDRQHHGFVTIDDGVHGDDRRMFAMGQVDDVDIVDVIVSRTDREATKRKNVAEAGPSRAKLA
jgi:hypothetical protein